MTTAQTVEQKEILQGLKSFMFDVVNEGRIATRRCEELRQNGEDVSALLPVMNRALQSRLTVEEQGRR